MSVFSKVGGLKPSRNVFNLSYEKKFTCDFGQLIPVCHDEMVPGDKFKISASCVVRMQPLNAPIMHEVNVYAHYFFVPYRLLWNNDTAQLGAAGYDKPSRYTETTSFNLVNSGTWEEFITCGRNGPSTSIGNYVIPRFMVPTGNWASATGIGSLWDYFGFPTGVTAPTGLPTSYYAGLFQDSTKAPFWTLPIVFPWSAYNLIYNDYYRDENFKEKIPLNATAVRNRNWEKDYFTSSMFDMQRGTAPAIPLYGTAPLSIVFSDGRTIEDGVGFQPIDSIASGQAFAIGNPNVSANRAMIAGNNTTGSSLTATNIGELRANLDNVEAGDIADLRLSFQIQKWMERNMRAGVRYTEFLKAHFSISPRDETLQRPVYIGGFKVPVMVSQVLQTSSKGGASGDETVLAQQAGNGIAAASQKIGTYLAKEYGIVMGILSVMPRTSYQQGINRQWLRRSPFDFYFPEFSHLSEQGIEDEEIYFTGNGNYDDHTGDNHIFGYQGRYDEMRYKPNLVCSEMRETFAYWHLGRKFSSKPSLGATFLECNANNDALKRVFAVTNKPGLIINYANIIKAYRPIPITGEPGLIDHN